MGMYDTFGETRTQLKVGNCVCSFYSVGDKVRDIPDGIYVACEGIIVIKDGIFIAEFDPDELCDKWGYSVPVDLDQNNPVVQTMNAINAAHVPEPENPAPKNTMVREGFEGK